MLDCDIESSVTAGTIFQDTRQPDPLVSGVVVGNVSEEMVPAPWAFSGYSG